MTFRNYQQWMHQIQGDLAELLGSPVRAFQLEWQLEQSLEQRGRTVHRAGLTTAGPIDCLKSGRPGHELSIGVQVYELDDDDGTFAIAQVIPPYSLRLGGFWAVCLTDYRRVYRLIRRMVRASHEACVEPFLDPAVKQRLVDHTIGFLGRDHSELKRFDVPTKRGVLLTGEPGNGKTMACRWLAARCQRAGLVWENVTRTQYEAAIRDGDVCELFETSRPGIIVFDDFDMALRQRTHHDDSRDQSTFLTNLDGVHLRTGVVYVFTSNLTIDAVDGALRRPGRIDQVIHFPKPSFDQRKRFIQTRWQTEIISELDVDRVAVETESRSYAELEELRKLLALRFLDTGRVDWPWARETFAGRCGLAPDGRRIGFTPALDAAQTPPSHLAAHATE